MAGFLKCADCHKSMNIKKGKNKEYYYCSSYTRNKTCTKHSISKNIVEEFVRDKLRKDKNEGKLSRKIIYQYIKCIYIDEGNDITIEYKD